MFRTKRSHVTQHATSELLKRFPSTKSAVWTLRHFYANFSFEKVLNNFQNLNPSVRRRLETGGSRGSKRLRYI